MTKATQSIKARVRGQGAAGLTTNYKILAAGSCTLKSPRRKLKVSVCVFKKHFYYIFETQKGNLKPMKFYVRKDTFVVLENMALEVFHEAVLPRQRIGTHTPQPSDSLPQRVGGGAQEGGK